MNRDVLNDISKRYQDLKTQRSGWDSAWRQLAELFLPTRYRDDTETTGHLSPKLNSRLVNTTGVLAMRTLAAGMQGGMTSPVRPWFRLRLRNRDLEAQGINQWVDEVTQRMQFFLHHSNFYNLAHSLYADLGTFGTALLVETADADGLAFHLVRAGEYVLDIDGRNQVDTFYRRLHMTARQIIDRWGHTGNVPEMIERRARSPRSGDLTERFDVIHAVFPRRDLKAGVAIGAESKPYASVYFLPGATSEGNDSAGAKVTLLDEGGFDMFPAFAPRWDVSGDDVYGRSPAMDILPDVRMVQAMTTTLRTMQHKIADPPIMAEQSLKAHGVKLTPGSISYYTPTGQSGGMPVQPIHQPQPQALNFTMQAVQEVQQTINDGLYTDLFRLLIDDDRRQITATEINAKMQEKMVLIGPVVERLQKEFLEPLIMRTYGLMREWGALPELPEGTEDADLDVSFESVLYQAQRMTATSSIEQGLSFMSNIAQASPEALDVMDMDETAKAYLNRLGVPESCLRDDRAIQELRQQRAQQQAMAQQMAQEQQQLDQIGQLSEVAKNLGQAPTGADGQTALGTILGGLGGV